MRINCVYNNWLFKAGANLGLKFNNDAVLARITRYFCTSGKPQKRKMLFIETRFLDQIKIDYMLMLLITYNNIACLVFPY